MTDTSQPLFLFGAGYCATVLAKIWGGAIVATRRKSVAPAYANSVSGVCVSVQDVAGLAQHTSGAHILISAPPGEDGCPALAVLGDFVCDAASVTYLSTTGVYGDLGGGWAMEWTQVNPGSMRARRRVLAEDSWRAVRPDLRIVRLPGIYGPGRSVFDRLRKGGAKRIVKPGQVFSRAHVDDIASGLKALILSGASGVFHLCDEEAAPPQDVTAFAAQLLGLEPPPETAFETADLPPMARSFYSECKRVSNARVKAVTGWRPAYPSYREGLRAILAAGG